MFLRAVAREASADGVNPAAADGQTAALRGLLVAATAAALSFCVSPWLQQPVPVDVSTISG